ncbi:hypothetical protein T8A63_07330 [Sulfitobacter sp. OXR-159]|uniref:hypothetical protein n=1 Tax=Sulfitobacter sp. OXR-159 TaxID=3100174 RepID=UPI002AC936A6|nr:hypothetical protein [Sulfitobacter sp. OXR-159]WPZ30767.1 hypothetical protein T8A63_06820 [Sulfitobacter sp. OXR-159]WPZ30868.1 hypothetical protein T8A63_07330 [Sulfitobacter sp. OXR-159]
MVSIVSGFVDGYFKGRDWRDEKEDRELDRARQERLDALNEEKHGAQMAEYEQMSGLRNSREARASATHGNQMDEYEYAAAKRAEKDAREAQEREFLRGQAEMLEQARELGAVPPNPAAAQGGRAVNPRVDPRSYPLGVVERGADGSPSQRHPSVSARHELSLGALAPSVAPQPTAPANAVPPTASGESDADFATRVAEARERTNQVLRNTAPGSAPSGGNIAAPQAAQQPTGSTVGSPSTSMGAIPEEPLQPLAGGEGSDNLAGDTAIGAATIEAQQTLELAHKSGAVLGLPAGQNYTPKQMKRAETEYVDRYREISRNAVKFYMKRGEPEKAKAYVEFVDSQIGREVILDNARAAAAYHLGDFDGVIKHSLSAAKRAGTMDPSLTVDEEATRFITDAQGNPIGGIAVYSDGGGNVFEKRFDDVDEIMRELTLLASPSMAVEKMVAGKPAPLSTQGKVARDVEAGHLTEEQAASVLDPAPDEYARYVRDEVEAGREPLSRIDYAQAKKGNGVSVTSPDGSIIRVGGKQEKLNEGESKTLVYATRAKGAIKSLDQYDKALSNRWERLAELDPTGFAREFQSEDFQLAKQAGDEFLQAILRKDTGAAITEQEQELYGKTYLPQPGDSEALLRQKRESRQRAIIALESGMTRDMLDRLAETEKASLYADVADGGAGGGGQTQPATQNEPEAAVINSDEEYDALPSGAMFTGPDGSTRRKP